MSADDFAEEVAARIAEAVMGDLQDRSGILDGVEDDIIEEIRASICHTACHIILRDML